MRINRTVLFLSMGMNIVTAYLLFQGQKPLILPNIPPQSVVEKPSTSLSPIFGGALSPAKAEAETVTKSRAKAPDPTQIAAQSEATEAEHEQAIRDNQEQARLAFGGHSLPVLPSAQESAGLEK